MWQRSVQPSWATPPTERTRTLSLPGLHLDSAFSGMRPRQLTRRACPWCCSPRAGVRAMAYRGGERRGGGRRRRGRGRRDSLNGNGKGNGNGSTKHHQQRPQKEKNGRANAEETGASSNPPKPSALVETQPSSCVNLQPGEPWWATCQASSVKPVR